jgi:hypothetical protein
MEHDPRHAQPAPEGPDPKRWWLLRFIGLGLVVAAMLLYFSGILGWVPRPAQAFVGIVMTVLGVILLAMSWLIPWQMEG